MMRLHITIMRCRKTTKEGGKEMAGNNGGGLGFWGVVGAVLLALIIFAVIG